MQKKTQIKFNLVKDSSKSFPDIVCAIFILFYATVIYVHFFFAMFYDGNGIKVQIKFKSKHKSEAQ